MRRYFIVVMALALSSCSALTPGMDNSPPAPLQQSTIDEKGLLAAWSAFDVALTAVDGLVAAKVIVPGTGKALTIAAHLSTAQTALNAATAAQRSGSASSYLAALSEAEQALRLASALLKGI